MYHKANYPKIKYKSKLIYLVDTTLHLITNAKGSFNNADVQNVTSTNLNIVHSKF